MSADGLLAEIESLTYRARCERLTVLHTHMDPADLSHLIGELDGRGAYERSAGLFIAAAARDEGSLAHIAAAVGDADADIAASAIGLLDRPIGSAFAVAEVAGALARPLGDGDPFAGTPVRYEHADAEFGPFADTNPADVLSHATAAAERDDLAAGVAAVALTHACGPRTGWSEPWRRLLRDLRVHPHPDVSYLAHRVHTTIE
jgi:hypothetical protein